jgi:tetratricopeptide (TPR) repeat protein
MSVRALLVCAPAAALALAAAACGPKLPEPGEPKLPAAKPEAVELLKDAARMVRLGPANYDRALEKLRFAVESDDKLWEAHYDIGWIELKRRHPAQAALALEKALDILPTHVPAVQALGEAYAQLGRAGDAARLYRGWIDRRPSDPRTAELRVALGAALRRAGKLDDALETLRQALSHKPRSAPALNELALVYRAKDQLDLADLVLHRALEVDDKSAAAAVTWNNLGLVALARRRDQEAFAHFDQATRLDPSLLVARRNKAAVYLDCGDYARAADELKHLTRGEAAEVADIVAFGVAERGLGHMEQAERAFERALDVDPAAPDALYDLGILYMDFKKDLVRARDRFAEFVKVAPSSHPRRADGEARLKELAAKVGPPPSSTGTAPAPAIGGAAPPKGGKP